jgi:hypothetical protein
MIRSGIHRPQMTNIQNFHFTGTSRKSSTHPSRVTRRRDSPTPISDENLISAKHPTSDETIKTIEDTFRGSSQIVAQIDFPHPNGKFPRDERPE